MNLVKTLSSLTTRRFQPRQVWWLIIVSAAILLVPHRAAAQTYNWSFGFPGTPDCVQVPYANFAHCATAEAACASIAAIEFGGPHYVSPAVQSNGSGYSEAALCNYYYGPWGTWLSIGLSTVCPSGQVSDYNSPPGCSPSGPNGTQPDKRIGGASAANVDTLNDPTGSCPKKCSSANGTASVSSDGGVSVAEPIDVASGNVFYETVDYATAGQNRLGVARFFNSRMFSDTALGSHWRSNYDRYLFVGSSAVIAERADGQKVTFTLSGSTWIGDKDVDYRLSHSGSKWTLICPDDAVETYTINEAGTQALLDSIMLRNGYTQQITRNSLLQVASVIDSFSRSLTFSYSPENTLSSVTTPDDTTISYGYTSGNSGYNLTSVKWPTLPATTVTYAYTDPVVPNALTSITDESGQIYATWTYDAYGRGLTSQLGSIADLTGVAYNDSTGSRVVSGPLGSADSYTFVTLNNEPKVTTISRGSTFTTAAATRAFAYDATGYLASSSDWNGNKTTYVNSVHGLPTTISEAVGSAAARTTMIAYDPHWVHLPQTITTAGLTTSFAYDAYGEPLTTISTDTTTNTVPYTSNGQTRTWTNTWSNHLLASTKNPNGHTMTLGYDSSGALTSITDALGHITSITSHGGGGLPKTIVDSNGVLTTIVYDPRQRPTSSTVTTAAGPLTTSWEYFTDGGIRTTLPDGSSSEQVVDSAHRLIALADNYDDQIDWTLDSMGNAISRLTFDPAGKAYFWRAAAFDALGNKIQDKSIATGASSIFTYDKNGNLLSTKDPLGHLTAFTYDALNRLQRTTDAIAGISSQVYDAHDRPLTVTDKNGHTTTFIYNGFGDVIQQTSPDSGVTIYRYDAMGHPSSKTDTASVVTNNTYDSLERRLTVTYPADATLNVTYTYDQTGTPFGKGVGRLTTLKDGAGTLTRSYDELGNILTEKRAIGARTLTTSYSYDKAGRGASTTYPSGATSSNVRDAVGRVTSMPFTAAGADLESSVDSVAYVPYGPISHIAYGQGDSANFVFDQDYRMSNLEYDAYGGAPYVKWTHHYDNADNLTSVTDSLTPANGQTFGYDPLHRLISAASSGTYGTLGWSYDHNGNILTRAVGTATFTFGYASGSNRLLTSVGPGVSQILGYTATGNVNSLMANGVPSLVMTYSKANRLTAMLGSGDSIALVGATYDAFGKRITKTDNGYPLIFFTYDLDGKLIEENDGGAITDYIYLDGKNIANWSPAQHHLYIVNYDRLGVPIVSRDEYGLTNWAAYRQPYGSMTQTVTAGQYSGPVTQNLRLPGQFYDNEAGFHYNGFRDYFPGVGRYMEADPGRFRGAINSYAYASGNPISRVDPKGLRDVVVAVWASRYLGYLYDNGSVGHVFVGETNGDPILSQFPNPHGMTGVNTQLDWETTLAKEGRDADAFFLVHVSDDYGFDNAANALTGTPIWAWNPHYDGTTNCTDAAYNALWFGGVDLPAPSSAIWTPNNLLDALTQMSNRDGLVSKLHQSPW